MDKHELRQEILEKRDALSKEDRVKLSSEIRQKLIHLPAFLDAKTVLFYMSFRSEVITKDMISDALKVKRVVVPIVRMKERRLDLSEIKSLEGLEENGYGILEPNNPDYVNPTEIDLVVVPGSVFDEVGNRIGTGMGFYDRLLSQIKAPKIALVFDFQVVSHIDVADYDIPMDVIITDKRIIECK